VIINLKGGRRALLPSTLLLTAKIIVNTGAVEIVFKKYAKMVLYAL
jgi:hypothetical protein